MFPHLSQHLGVILVSPPAGEELERRRHNTYVVDRSVGFI